MADPVHLTHGWHIRPADRCAFVGLAQNLPVALPGLMLLVKSLPDGTHLIPSVPFLQSQGARLTSLF